MAILHQDVISLLEKLVDLESEFNLTEIMRKSAETVINELMDMHAEQIASDLDIPRNGYRERKLNTLAGPITLKIPKLRCQTYFPDFLIDRYSRTDKAVISIAAEMYSKGMSTRKIEDTMQGLNLPSISKSTVSNLCKCLDEEVEGLVSADLSASACPYLWVDATYIYCRGEKHVQSMSVVTAITVDSLGYRKFIGVDVFDTESYLDWYNFLKSLRDRGLSGVQCVTSDAHPGLKRAIKEVFNGAAWQRCIVHLERDVLRAVSNHKQRVLFAKFMKEVFAEKDPSLVRELYRQAGQKIFTLNKEAGKVFLEAENEALCYLDFPMPHHRRLRTNNVQERSNREIKRRSDVVQIFPGTKSLIRLVGTILIDMNEKWATRRYFSSSSISLCFEEFERPENVLTFEENKTQARMILELAEREVIASRKRVA